ncbi:tRNA uridine(34) 5-carboxymethylaminomethyl modification radical SAM/GNAT enzyme Elp3 [Patescibacteria group bacterium]|nr:tRNA uridine(34) 5-carboxymethylaminomethyl modification radical SAM/GNAT enzyme Elp3 [Patescibacteria group bacterium]
MKADKQDQIGIEQDILQQMVRAALKKEAVTAEELSDIKKKFCTQYKLERPPANQLIIKAYRALLESGEIEPDKNFEMIIRKRSIRTLSGIASIGVLTKPYPCPGQCIFCPNETEMPKSYLSNQPAAMRAVLNDFDPYKQVITRLRAYRENGHDTDKIELIVMGGTFNYLPRRYQTHFIKKCLDALNGKNSRTFEEAVKLNEKAEHRLVGLTLETRPDFITKPEMRRFRKLGCTKIEIGVQTIYDDILKLNSRGHGRAKTITAIRLMKDAGFKIGLHLMPNLYGSDTTRDFQMFEELYSNPDFTPDYIKIYPCVVVKQTKLYDLWQAGEYRSYTDDEMAELLLKIKAITPPYVRIMRIFRDIPSDSIESGSKMSNFRQILHQRMKKMNIFCKCIRCREIMGDTASAKDVKLCELKYDSSGGIDYFLSYDDTSKDKLLSMLRLRIPGETYIKELTGAAIIREVHTYGQQLKIDTKNKNASQHFGFGKKLISRAEEIAGEHGLKKVAVISAIGTRKYYEKMGYKLEGTYMTKKLKN